MFLGRSHATAQVDKLHLDSGKLAEDRKRLFDTSLILNAFHKYFCKLFGGNNRTCLIVEINELQHTM